MTHAELVERVAKAIFKADGLVHGSDEKMFEAIEWEELDAADYQCIRDGYRARARAAIAECSQAMLEPDPARDVVMGTAIETSLFGASENVFEASARAWNEAVNQSALNEGPTP